MTTKAPTSEELRLLAHRITNSSNSIAAARLHGLPLDPRAEERLAALRAEYARLSAMSRSN